MAARNSARTIARRLAELGWRVVFAESCTAGLVAATLSSVPGISQWLCGSAVTYRNDTKTQWLDVPATIVRSHSAVSETVTRRMALNVLKSTPEASIAAAVTGHLGPGAPKRLDGTVYISVARRSASRNRIVSMEEFRLSSSTRIARQREAVQLVFQQLLEALDEASI